MPQRSWRTWKRRPEIGWRHWPATGKASTAFGSTISTGFASYGGIRMRTKSKSSITTKELQSKDRLPPVAPGEILLEEFMKPIPLSAHALALFLHVPATRIQAIVNGKRAITADT